MCGALNKADRFHDVDSNAVGESGMILGVSCCAPMTVSARTPGYADEKVLTVL